MMMYQKAEIDDLRERVEFLERRANDTQKHIEGLMSLIDKLKHNQQQVVSGIQKELERRG